MIVVRTLIAVILSVALLTVSMVSAQQRPVSIRYLGWAFSLVTAADGLRIAIDPYGNIGYPFPTVEADVVLVTHEHGDHNNVGLVRGAPRVFRGLAPGAADWNRVYERIGGTLVYAVPGFHDSEQGTTPRGLDAFFVIDSGGVRIAHLGDIGQPTLSDGQLRALGSIDVLMIPVGAGPTVSVPTRTASSIRSARRSSSRCITRPRCGRRRGRASMSGRFWKANRAAAGSAVIPSA